MFHFNSFFSCLLSSFFGSLGYFLDFFNFILAFFLSFLHFPDSFLNFCSRCLHGFVYSFRCFLFVCFHSLSRFFLSFLDLLLGIIFLFLNFHGGCFFVLNCCILTVDLALSCLLLGFIDFSMGNCN